MVTTGFTVHKFSTCNMKYFIHALIYLCMYIRVPTSKTYQPHYQLYHAWFHLTSTLFFNNEMSVNQSLIFRIWITRLHCIHAALHKADHPRSQRATHSSPLYFHSVFEGIAKEHRNFSNLINNKKVSLGCVHFAKSRWKITVASFVVIWQNLSNHGLTRLKRFVPTFTDKLCN
jgi:hypothetical protein